MVAGRDRVAGLGGAELREGADVTRHAGVDLAQCGAERGVDVGETLVGVVAVGLGAVRLAVALGRDDHVVPADVHGRLRAQRPGEHPHHRHAPDVRIGGRAHDLGGERALRVGRERRMRGPVDAGDRRERSLQR